MFKDVAKNVRIKIGTIEAIAELNETRTAKAIWELLAIKGQVNLWGEDNYRKKR